MSIDSPARIAIMGAGPIGLEAALYARFLGFDVQIYEQRGLAENVRRWGHVRMFSPFRMNASPLGLAALAAQDDAYCPPSPDDLLTGNQYAERYLIPLSQTDLLSDHLRLNTQVVNVGRQDLLKDQPLSSAGRVDADFELLVDAAGGERREAADVVIDTTGTYDTPRWLGAAGIPAIGERSLATRIHYHLPDVLGADRERFARARTLVVGSGYSAATTILSLCELASQTADGEIYWVTRRGDTPVLRSINHDILPARAQLAATANQLAAGGSPALRHFAGYQIERLADTSDGNIEVQLNGPSNETLRVDHVVAHVGYRPNNDIVNELAVHRCYATEGPMQLAATLLDHSSEDCLAQPIADIDALLTTEPRFFVLGSKSYGRNSNFLIAHGLEQIRQVFSFLGDRSDLDLYGNINHQTP